MGRGRGNSQANSSANLTTSLRVVQRQDSTLEQLEDVFVDIDEYDNLETMRTKAVQMGAYDADDYIKSLQGSLKEKPLSDKEAEELKSDLDRVNGWDTSISDLTREEIAECLSEPLNERIQLPAQFNKVKEGIILTMSSSMKRAFEKQIGWDNSISDLSPEKIQASFNEILSSDV